MTRIRPAPPGPASLLAIGDAAALPVRTAPASLAQRRLWFLQQLRPEERAYQACVSFALSGELDVEALRRAMAGVTERHEILRTRLVADGQGEPVQVVAAVDPGALPLTDLTGLPAGAREDAGARWLDAQPRRPIDLTRDAPFRAAIARLSPTRHLLVMTCHHVAFDGWSWPVFCGDLCHLYEAFTSGRASDLRPLPLQYADFAHRQRERESSAEWNEQLRYWRRQLAGVPPVTALPLDRCRPRESTYRGGKVSVDIPVFLADAARQAGSQLRCTLFMTLLTVFQTLLYRCGGDQAVVVGTPVAGRDDVSLEDLIGFFVSTVAVRADFDDRVTFGDLLTRARTTILQAISRQDVPFDMVVSELGADRQLAHHPIFQSVFQLDGGGVADLGFPGVSCAEVGPERDECAWDLHMCLSEQPDGGLGGWLAYSSDIFDYGTAARLARNYVELLRALVSAPDVPVSGVPLLSEQERSQVLGSWSDGGSARLPDRRLHDFADDIARTTPDAVAVEYQGEQVTYGELACRSNQLAHYLRAAGVGSETVVGVLLDAGIDAVTALLGVHKAGGVYLGIDARHPRAWIQHILTDSGARLVVTRSGLAELAGGTLCLRLDRAGDELAAQPDAPVAGRAGANNAAYIVYTGGSTGRPKGVVIEHRSLTNHVIDTIESGLIRASDRCLQFMSYGFDGWIGELTEALSAGATLVVRDHGFDLSPTCFTERCRELRISAMRLPTSYWNQLVDAGAAADLGKCPDLRWVSIGGAMASPDRIRRWYDAAGDRVQLRNRYGPSECAITCATAVLTSGEQGAAVPVGGPMRNTRMYILNRMGQLAGIGEVGELYIAGPGLARGYVGRPDPTAASFVPDALGGTPGGRLYRSGDLARWLPTGDVVILGRVDNQIKLRGYRIEPVDIEVTLREHPAVRDVLVRLHQAPSGDPHLVAYVVPEASPSSASAHDDPGQVQLALRDFLAARLPEYMIPASFTLLPELPRTSSGKLDQARLPAPADPRAASVRPAAPRDKIERRLSEIWKDVLGIPDIGMDDDFFLLGGHSLLAVRLVARIEQALGIPLPVSVLFPRATIRGMSELVRGRGGRRDRVVVRLRDEPGGPEVVLIHPAAGEVMHYSALARALPGPSTVLGVRSPLISDGTARFADLESMAADYLARLRAQGISRPTLYGGWSLGGRIALEMAWQAHRDDAVNPPPVLAIDTALAAPDAPLVELDEEALLTPFVEDVCRTTGIPQPDCWPGNGDRLLGLHAALQGAGQAGPEQSPDWLVARFRAFSQHSRLALAYRPRPYPGRVILVLAAGREDRAATLDAWRAVAGGGLEVHEVAADHYSIVTKAHVSSITNALSFLAKEIRAK